MWQANPSVSEQRLVSAFPIMTPDFEPVYTRRRKQACSRCHTKRIKCLGDIPCRNCSLSSSSCVFPPPRKSRESVSQQPSALPSSGALNVNSIPSVISEPAAFSFSPFVSSYRRPEKDFSSSRSGHSHDSASARPSYRGNPSCKFFVGQIINWTASQKTQLQLRTESYSDPSWTPQDNSDSAIADSVLEISIDTVASQPPINSRSSKLMKIRLPPYNHSIRLIQSLEFAIGHEQHYFRRRDLRAKVAYMHQNPESTASKDQGWLCHWLAIVALGELYSKNLSGEPEPQIYWGREGSAPYDRLEPPGADYYHQSVGLLQQVAENPDVQYIETLCLLTLYAFSMDRVNTAYMYVGVCLRAALSLDLHRNASDFPSERSNLPIGELEHQKRLFWTVYYQDLLTTATTGRPWGVLDDEITVEYADSSRLSGEDLPDFFASDESNAHLELMRLRSQGYSSLYGYAGTAINPFSYISMSDFDLSWSLSEQHLDKMTEFYQGLLSWESELPPSLMVNKDWDGSRLNLNQVNANMYLIYYQSILVLLRPALVNTYKDTFDFLPNHNNTTSAGDAQPIISSSASTSRLQLLYQASLDSARETASILQWLQTQGALSTYSYFTASFAFTAAITLYIARATNRISTQSHYTEMRHTHNNTNHNFSFPFTHIDHSALETALHILAQQSAAGNVPANEFCRLLHLLDDNLQALHTALQSYSTTFGSIECDDTTLRILG